MKTQYLTYEEAAKSVRNQLRPYNAASIVQHALALIYSSKVAGSVLTFQHSSDTILTGRFRTEISDAFILLRVPIIRGTFPLTTM